VRDCPTLQLNTKVNEREVYALSSFKSDFFFGRNYKILLPISITISYLKLKLKAGGGGYGVQCHFQ
jgi:hypothetical protein